MISVRDLMITELITISPDESVYRAINIMDRHHIGCLPVIDSGLLVGMLTSRDVRRSHPNRLVVDAMSNGLVTATPEASLLQALDLMNSYDIERLAVVDGEVLLGMITKAQVIAEISKHIDSLTGLFKAEIMLFKINELIKNEDSFGIMFLDLDNFGSIDKKLGHVVGDQILKQVADLLKSILDKSCDAVYRYAGDEFVVVTTRDKSETYDLAKLLTNCFSQNSWYPDISVTVSIGIVSSSSSPYNLLKDIVAYTLRLVNLASLASSTAKNDHIPIVVVDDGYSRKAYATA